MSVFIKTLWIRLFKFQDKFMHVIYKDSTRVWICPKMCSDAISLMPYNITLKYKPNLFTSINGFTNKVEHFKNYTHLNWKVHNIYKYLSTRLNDPKHLSPYLAY